MLPIIRSRAERRSKKFIRNVDSRHLYEFTDESHVGCRHPGNLFGTGPMKMYENNRVDKSSSFSHVNEETE